MLAHIGKKSDVHAAREMNLERKLTLMHDQLFRRRLADDFLLHLRGPRAAARPHFQNHALTRYGVEQRPRDQPSMLDEAAAVDVQDGVVAEEVGGKSRYTIAFAMENPTRARPHQPQRLS